MDPGGSGAARLPGGFSGDSFETPCGPPLATHVVVSNDTIPDAGEQGVQSISVAMPVAAAVADAARKSVHTIPDEAPSISISAIEAAPAVAPPLPAAAANVNAPSLPPRPAPVVTAPAVAAAPVVAPAPEAPMAAPVAVPEPVAAAIPPGEIPPPPAFVTAQGMSIPVPPAFLTAAMVEAAVPAASAPATIPTFPAAAPVDTTAEPAPATRPFELSISDEGSLPPLTLSPDIDDLDFPAMPRSRSMLDSIWMPEDPVLTQKMEPEVAARRARFQRFVKGTIGGCAAMCVVAMFCTLVSHLSASNATDDARPVAIAHSGRTSVETFEEVDYGRAARGVTKAVRARSQARR